MTEEQKWETHPYEEKRPALTDREVGQILDSLRDRGELVTTVESLTAGMIAARIADIPGSSDVLRRAFVTYSDEAKHEMVGVKRSTLDRWTAVSARSAQEMAEGGAREASAAACLSATGYAGPASGPEDTTVGHVFLGCCYHGQTVVEEHRYRGERNEVRSQAMNDALRMLAAALRGSGRCIAEADCPELGMNVQTKMINNRERM